YCYYSGHTLLCNRSIFSVKTAKLAELALKIKMIKLAKTVTLKIMRKEPYWFNRVYPNKPKMVEIIPILKADNKTDESNRIFENFMYNRIKSFIKQNKLVSLSQYGSSLSISSSLEKSKSSSSAHVCKLRTL
ncbi:hypothetical protein pdam_00024498, partial [Pocillopora damicornis]